MKLESACDSRKQSSCLGDEKGYDWYVSRELSGLPFDHARGIDEQAFGVVVRWHDHRRLRTWKRKALAASITPYEGDFDILVEEHPDASYAPGQRGHGTVTTIQHDGWAGRHVARRGRFVFPNSAVSAPQWVRSWVVSRGNYGILLTVRAASKERIGAYDDPLLHLVDALGS